MIHSNEAICFDVERGLSKALGSRVETYVCKPDEYKLRIGQHWNLHLTQEQLEALWENADSPQALRDTFDSLKSEALTFQSYAR